MVFMLVGFSSQFAYASHEADSSVENSVDESTNGSGVKKEIRTVITIDQAVITVRQQVSGRVLNARKTRRNGDRQVYLVKILTTDGRVRLIPVDAYSGSILSVNQK